MPERTDDAKSSGTGSDAISLRRGTGDSTENLFTSLRPHTEAPTRLRTASGDAAVARDATPGATTPASSSPLSAADEQRLWRIRKDRANRFMVSVTDVDFLLEIVERLSR